MIPYRTLYRNEDLPAYSKIKWPLLILIICSLFFLVGCDPCNPMGIRGLGIVPSEIDPEVPVIAIAPIWGICGVDYYKSIDGGLTWNPTKDYKGLKFNEVSVFTGDCVRSCEFVDPQMNQIRYRIITGKYLQRSLDGGNTWQEELIVPAWNRMEKNYVNSKFRDMGGIPRDMRGPFSAITDSNTGNLIVAMGIEGVLVRSQDKQWTWVILDSFKQINPSRLDMLNLIPNQEWLIGLLIATISMLFGLYISGFKRFRLISIFMMTLAFWFILIPLNSIGILISSLTPRLLPTLSNETIYMWIQPLIIISVLVGLILINLIIAWKKIPSLVLSIAALSIASAIGYCLVLVAWSQGIILSDYSFARLLGLALFVIALILIYKTSSNIRASGFDHESTPN